MNRIILMIQKQSDLNEIKKTNPNLRVKHSNWFVVGWLVFLLKQSKTNKERHGGVQHCCQHE